MSEQGSLTTTGEFLNVSTLDPLLPTFLIATLCLCALSVITYYSLAVAWEVFWASRRSPSPLDPSAEVVLTPAGVEITTGRKVEAMLHVQRPFSEVLGYQHFVDLQNCLHQ